MKTFLLSLAAVSLLAACDAKVNVPASDSTHTTVVTPSGSEKKTETNTTVTPGGSVSKSTTTEVK
jgi:hypothetical protein